MCQDPALARPETSGKATPPRSPRAARQATGRIGHVGCVFWGTRSVAEHPAQRYAALRRALQRSHTRVDRHLGRRLRSRLAMDPLPGLHLVGLAACGTGRSCSSARSSSPPNSCLPVVRWISGHVPGSPQRRSARSSRTRCTPRRHTSPRRRSARPEGPKNPPARPGRVNSSQVASRCPCKTLSSGRSRRGPPLRGTERRRQAPAGQLSRRPRPS